MSWVQSGLSYLGSRSSAKQSQESAREQMEFQRQMSNTAYRRAVRDMKAAGLNPMLAAKIGGASTPSGAMAQIPDYGQAIQRGASAAQSAATIDKIDQEVKNLGLDEVAKRLDNDSKTLLVNFEKALSPEEYALYKQPVLKALANLLNVPQMAGTIGNSELAKGVSRLVQFYSNPMDEFPAFLKELGNIGEAGMKYMDETVRKASGVIVEFVKSIGE
jgi:hypothetical protein